METNPRPAYYALPSGAWRDYVTVLHLPYTAWHLGYVLLGAAAAPVVFPDRVAGVTLAFFLAVGVAAHALDEYRGRPLRTHIPDATLLAVATASLAGSIAIGVAAALTIRPLGDPLRCPGRVPSACVQPRAVPEPVPLRPLVRDRLGSLPGAGWVLG